MSEYPKHVLFTSRENIDALLSWTTRYPQHVVAEVRAWLLENEHAPDAELSLSKRRVMALLDAIDSKEPAEAGSGSAEVIGD